MEPSVTFSFLIRFCEKCITGIKVDLGGHTKAVTCISIEPAGNRVVTGSLDYHLKLFDFGGMDRYGVRQAGDEHTVPLV
jgi:WD40 repeat protein